MVSGDMVPGCVVLILLLLVVAAVAIGGWELAQWLWAHFSATGQ